MMKKPTAANSKRPGNSVSPTARAGRFVVGRDAFARISAVEGITLSPAMKATLDKTERMPPEQRRRTLASTYGKK